MKINFNQVYFHPTHKQQTLKCSGCGVENEQGSMLCYACGKSLTIEQEIWDSLDEAYEKLAEQRQKEMRKLSRMGC